MSFRRDQMLYINDDYYKWNAFDANDNPYYRGGTDHSELNRTEGYEVLYFINHIVKERWKAVVQLTVYQKIERMIRHSVPDTIKKHKEIEDWIVDNWNSY